MFFSSFLFHEYIPSSRLYIFLEYSFRVKIWIWEEIFFQHQYFNSNACNFVSYFFIWIWFAAVFESRDTLIKLNSYTWSFRSMHFVYFKFVKSIVSALEFICIWLSVSKWNKDLNIEAINIWILLWFCRFDSILNPLVKIIFQISLSYVGA